MRDRRPNFLFIQADQMAAPAMPFHGHNVVKAPHMQSLADEGVVFDSAYCNFPLCAPSRFSMLSGQLASRIGAYDNAAEFPASVPTAAHYLRRLGYYTCLSGKMHFIGPDQLHGFEERLTTDIYPSDFLWTADWSPKEHTSTSEMGVVVKAGPCQRSVQVDYDDEVTFHAVRKIYDIARYQPNQPFFLAVSFTHPHDPFNTPVEYWDRYDHESIDNPKVSPDYDCERDPHSKRISDHFGIEAAKISNAQLRVARHAYYGSVSYVDDQVGTLLRALRSADLHENTIVILTSDHGEFLGERGLWFKRSFYEWSSRVPFVVHQPSRFAPRRVKQNVSLVDLLPTLIDLASDGDAPVPMDALDGHSLTGLFEGETDNWPDTAFGEILCECTTAPLLMIRRGRYKYVTCETDPPQLFDVEADPDELNNLAGRPEDSDIEAAFAEEAAKRWDTEALTRDIVTSQQRRLFLNQALSMGEIASWDFQPQVDASRQYYRGHGAADAGDLFERGLRYSLIEIEKNRVLYNGRKIGSDRESAILFLTSAHEIANALERQICEASGQL